MLLRQVRRFTNVSVKVVQRVRYGFRTGGARFASLPVDLLVFKDNLPFARPDCLYVQMSIVEVCVVGRFRTGTAEYQRSNVLAIDDAIGRRVSAAEYGERWKQINRCSQF